MNSTNKDKAMDSKQGDIVTLPRHGKRGRPCTVHRNALRLHAALEAAGATRTDLAEAAGCIKTQVTEVFKGNYAIKAGFADAVMGSLGTDAEGLERLGLVIVNGMACVAGTKAERLARKFGKRR